MARSSAPVRSCPACFSPLVEIRLGAELTLRSCSHCDRRYWAHGDRLTDLPGVLSVVAEADRRRGRLRSVS